MKDHKILYGIYLRVGMFFSIIVFIMLFLFVPYAEPEPYTLKSDAVTVLEEISTQIEKYEEPPPVERPRVAVEATNELIDEAVETIATTDLRENVIRIEPTGPDIEIVEYYKLQIKPTPIHIPKPRYPPLAIRAGIEGSSVITALVDIDGSIMEVKVLKSSGSDMLDQAALEAAMRARFTPAKQRDKFVRVWISIPMKFHLTGS
jgi:protein TonB